MDGTINSAGAPGVATLQSIEAHAIRAQASAHTVARLVDEALSSTHPSDAARCNIGIALLLDIVTYTGLSIATTDLLRHVRETHDAIRAASAASAAGGAA